MKLLQLFLRSIGIFFRDMNIVNNRRKYQQEKNDTKKEGEFFHKERIIMQVIFLSQEYTEKSIFSKRVFLVLNIFFLTKKQILLYFQCFIHHFKGGKDETVNTKRFYVN